MVSASIPSPSINSIDLGPLTIHFYGLIIFIGIVVAVLLTRVLFKRAGYDPEAVFDIALWAVLFGVIGGRLYHVITVPDKYFGENGELINILKIWEGGMAIIGAVTLGAVGVYIACRRNGIPLAAAADAIAPGLIFAQAIGRWGNWFNQELFGSPTALPWGLEIDDQHLPVGYESGTLFHPTFLYESIWNILIGCLLLVVTYKLTLKKGQIFWLYVIGYSIGRIFMETLRLDKAQIILGLRINMWAAIVLLAIGLVGFLWLQFRNKTIVNSENSRITGEADGN